MKILRLTVCIFIYFIFSFSEMAGQGRPRYLFFPGEISRNFNCSAGFLFTTTNKDITEELQFRIPAIDVHATQKIFKGLLGVGRINSQILQNHFMAGLRYNFTLKGRIALAVEDGMGFWQGHLKMEGFNISGRGWLNYPSVSAGVQVGENIYLTLRGEAILSISRRTFVGENLTQSNNRFYNGEAISVMLEQPFYDSRWCILGFRALYANYFWQTWPLFEPFDRNTFYPQIIVALIL